MLPSISLNEESTVVTHRNLTQVLFFAVYFSRGFSPASLVGAGKAWCGLPAPLFFWRLLYH